MCTSFRTMQGAFPGPSPSSRIWAFCKELLSLCIILTVIIIGLQTNTKEPQIYDLDDIDIEEYQEEPLRILLVGKTGVGKSATGNTILGRNVFKSEISSSSVTGHCERFHSVINGRIVSVIDSPGLFDTGLSTDEVVNRIKRCIPLSSPGPHVIIVVIQLGRFTAEEAQAVRIIQAVFGEVSSAYTMVLFTHGDKLEGKSIHSFVRQSKELLGFIKSCSGQYHVFNNKDKSPAQVIQLLEEIDKLVTGNGGSHYTSEMLETVERQLEKETQRILKEKEEEKQREIAELRAQLEDEAYEKALKQVNNKYDRMARYQAEIDFPLIINIVKFLFDVLGKFFF